MFSFHCFHFLVISNSSPLNGFEITNKIKKKNYRKHSMKYQAALSKVTKKNEENKNVNQSIPLKFCEKFGFILLVEIS